MACNGYLLHQFLSSAANDRTDEFNGDLRTRAKVLLAAIASVRNAVGRDFFVSVKLSGRDDHNAWTAPLNRTVGNTIEDTVEVARWLAEAGVDAIHLSQGDSFPHPRVPAGSFPLTMPAHIRGDVLRRVARSDDFFLLQFALIRRVIAWNWGRRMPFQRGGSLLPEAIEGMNQEDAAKIKSGSGLPVICVGGWQTAAPIRQALVAGRCDVVSIARGLLANRDLVNRFAEDKAAPRSLHILQ